MQSVGEGQSKGHLIKILTTSVRIRLQGFLTYFMTLPLQGQFSSEKAVRNLQPTT